MCQSGGDVLRHPSNSEITNRTKNTAKSSRAISVAAAAMPPKPNTAAMLATIKNRMDQPRPTKHGNGSFSTPRRSPAESTTSCRGIHTRPFAADRRTSQQSNWPTRLPDERYANAAFKTRELRGCGRRASLCRRHFHQLSQSGWVARRLASAPESDPLPTEEPRLDSLRQQGVAQDREQEQRPVQRWQPREPEVATHR